MAKSDNLERENRILDVAAELFIRYGFDKTAVNEIARGAGVSQGTIYLHFESKDALFEAVMLREVQTYSERWLELIDADPDGGTIASMYKNSLYAINSSPFMSAIMRQDGRIMGNYLRRRDAVLRPAHFMSQRAEFVTLMQQAGAVRTDVDAKVIAHIMTMVSYGLISMDDIIDRDDMPPVDDLIEGIALLMDRALTPEDGGNRDAGKAILMQIADNARQQLANLRHGEQEQGDEP